MIDAPRSFPSTERAYFSDWFNKARNAVARGAVGMIAIVSPEEQRRHPWNWIAAQVTSGGMNWLDNNGKPQKSCGLLPGDTFEQIHGRAFLGPRGAGLLFAGAPKPLAQVFADAKAGKSRAFTSTAIRIGADLGGKRQTVFGARRRQLTL